MELFNCLGVGVVWRCDESEVVLILLELGGHISGDITVRFKGKVLCLECRTEVVAADLKIWGSLYKAKLGKPR